MDKFFKISIDIVKYSFGFFIILYFVGNVFFTAYIDELVSNLVEFKFGLSLINIIIIFIILAVLLFLIKKDFFKLSEQKQLIFFLLFCLIIGLIWIFINDPVIKEMGDSYNCCDRAKAIASGDFSPLGYKTYINMYPNNLGFITYLILLIKMFGPESTLYIARIINLAMVIIGYMSLYGITKLQFKNNRLINCTLIYLCWFSTQFVFYAFMIYGNCISYSLALFSAYLLLKYFSNNRIKYLVFSIITIILAIAIKNNSIIILIAEIIYLILYIFKNKNWAIIIAIILMMIGSWVSTTGLQKFWGRFGEVDYSATKLPTICWIAYGLNYDETKPGSYTYEFEDFHFQNGFVQEYTALNAKAFIRGSLNTFKERPSLMIRFYGQKFLTAWCDPQYDCFDGYRALDNKDIVTNIIGGNINSILHNIWDSTMSVLAIGLIAYIIKRFKKMELDELFGAVVVLGGFFFHSFWEIKSIYLYQYFMYLIPYAAYGLVMLSSKVKNEK